MARTFFSDWRMSTLSRRRATSSVRARFSDSEEKQARLKTLSSFSTEERGKLEMGRVERRMSGGAYTHGSECGSRDHLQLRGWCESRLKSENMSGCESGKGIWEAHFAVCRDSDRLGREEMEIRERGTRMAVGRGGRTRVVS